MTNQEMADKIGAVKVTEHDLRFVLRAWFEVEDYPSEQQRRQAEIDANEVLHDIVRTKWVTEHDLRFADLRLANDFRQQEWDVDDQIDLAYRGNELAGEVGEACNVIKKIERERMGIRGSRATREQLAEELADVVICVDLIAMHVGINLEEAVRQKFNATSEKYGLQTRIPTCSRP